MKAFNFTLVMVILVVTCVPTSAQSRVAFKNNRLFVDGKPFFFLGADGVPDSLESMRRHHLNTVFGWGAVNREAGQAGLMFIPYLHSPNVELTQVEKQVTQLKDEPGLLAWNIGDDLVVKDLERTRLVSQAVHRIDPGRPVMLDVIDNSQSRFAPFVDMFCTYTYPLMKKDWSLQRYREWLESTKEAVGKEKLRWTWVQAHTQFWYTHEVHGGPEEDHIPSLFPDAEHIRLLTYTAIQAGVKGILYYHHRFLRDDWYGKDRYAEVGILGSELEVLGPLIAEGNVVGVARTNNRDVHAVVIQYSKGLLVILVKQGDRYQYQPDWGTAGKLTVTLPSLDSSTGGRKRRAMTAIQVDFPTFSRKAMNLPVWQKEDRLEFGLPIFELTAAVVLTDDQEFAASLKEKMNRLLPDAARSAIQVAEGKREKVEPVLKQLGELGVPVAEQTKWLDESKSTLVRARERLQIDDAVNAFRMARDAQRLLRVIESECWRTAVGKKNPDEWKYLRCFYDLPQHYAYVRKLESLIETEDLLANGSFEKGEGTQAADWNEPVTVANRQASGGRTDRKSRVGKWSYHFTSRSMALWEGGNYDWVTAEATSTPAEVRPGEIVKLSAWSHIPQPIRDTQRGAILNLVGLDDSGKAVPGWKGMDIEQADFRRTEGWRQLSLAREVDDKRVVKVAARIGICGVGECYFDEVRLCRMKPRDQ